MNSNYNIFICYRGDNDPHKDGKYIGLDVYSELQKIDGFDCFFAPKHNKSNDDFKHINAILNTVKVALLILTDGFFDRCYENDDIVKIELDEILKRDIAIIPIFVNNYNIQTDIKRFINYLKSCQSCQIPILNLI